jgi:hypothetical protein
MTTTLNIKITGSGSSAEIAGALRQIAEDLENGVHIPAIIMKDECEWEDSTLMTTITNFIN